MKAKNNGNHRLPQSRVSKSLNNNIIIIVTSKKCMALWTLSTMIILCNLKDKIACIGMHTFTIPQSCFFFCTVLCILCCVKILKPKMVKMKCKTNTSKFSKNYYFICAYALKFKFIIHLFSKLF